MKLILNIRSSPRNAQVSVAHLVNGSTKSKVTTMLLCTEAGIPERSFYDGSFDKSDMPSMTRAIATLKKSNIYIDAGSRFTLNELLDKVQILVRKSKVKLVVIDNAFNATIPGVSSYYEQLNGVSTQLKTLAVELNIPIVTTFYSRHNTPGLKDNSSSNRALPGYGVIECCSDVVGSLYCDVDMSAQPAESETRARLLIEKNNNGATGVCELLFNPHSGHFKEI